MERVDIWLCGLFVFAAGGGVSGRSVSSPTELAPSSADQRDNNSQESVGVAGQVGPRRNKQQRKTPLQSPVTCQKLLEAQRDVCGAKKEK